MSEREQRQEQEQEQYIPCDVCGGPACAGQGRFAVCNEYCDSVAKRFTDYGIRIATLEASENRLKDRVTHLESVCAGNNKDITELDKHIATLADEALRAAGYLGEGNE